MNYELRPKHFKHKQVNINSAILVKVQQTHFETKTTKPTRNDLMKTKDE